MNVLTKFESAADAAFLSHSLPHPNLYVAMWYLLVVAEDSQRNILIAEDGRIPQWRVEHLMDRFKYSLRSCLARARAEAKNTFPIPLPTRAPEAQYVLTRDLLLAGIDYSIASQICSSAHNGSARIVEGVDGFRVEIVEAVLDKRYGALEAMRQSGKGDVVPFSHLLRHWIRESEYRPVAVHPIVASTRLRNRRIVYEYNPVWAYGLSQNLPRSREIIPAEWEFPWGGHMDTTLLLNNLSIRALYHSLAITLGASKFELVGGAEYDLCLVQSRAQWIEDLTQLSSLDREKIERFVDCLTWGNGINSPDPALQPFISLGNQRLALGPLGWLSSNVERNVLSLQARLEPKRFNAQSKLFEVGMTESLLTALRHRWSLVAANRTFTFATSREEVDILVCEPESRTIAVLELRWMLPPGDPREVQLRKEACWEKTRQARRKSLAVRASLSHVLSTAFGISEPDPAGWTVGAIVVIEGFGGARSQDTEVPVVPDWVLEAGVSASSSLRQLLAWAVGLEWLPLEGRDFNTVESNFFRDQIEVAYPGLEPLRNGLSFLEDATAPLRGS